MFLLKKLEQYGIRWIVTKCLRSSLEDQPRFETIKVEKSYTIRPNVGVPKCCTSALLLFILYINDMISSCKNLSHIQFAHDTSAF